MRSTYRYVWAVLSIMLLQVATWAAPPDAGRVVVHTAWTPTALYLACRVDDPLVVGNQTLPLSHPWLDDAIAIYVNLGSAEAPALQEACLRVLVSAAGGATVQRWERGGWRDDPEWFQFSPKGTIRYGVRVQGTLNQSEAPDEGFQVELGLGWNLLGVPPPFTRREGEPLPSIGLAVACYSQGETSALSLWPPALTAAELENPARWGRLQFAQSQQPLPTQVGVASATLILANPQINGEIHGPEWMLAGALTFPKQWGATTAAPEGGPPRVSLLSAWYALDAPRPTVPPDAVAAHQPLEPEGPWAGPTTPLYHQLQLREIQRAGIDILGVALPATLERREAVRARLAALVAALRAHTQATAGEFVWQTPLLMPIVAFEASSTPTPQALEACLEDFLGLVPPQFRATLPDGEGIWCLPVGLTAPSAATAGSLAERLPTLTSRVYRKWDQRLGWLLDPGWPIRSDAAHVLARCPWEPTTGFALGEGPIPTVTLTPGAALRKWALPRRAGDLYQNGWMKITAAPPELILLRSWNEFLRGTEVAPSRQFGYRYLDSTKLATIQLTQGQAFALRILRHSLPTTLRSGAHYPVDVLVKNGSVTKLVTQAGYRVDFRVTRGETTVAGGLATPNLVLLELTAARIRFTLPVADKIGRSLAAGPYTLHLDFVRNKVPFVDLPFLSSIIGTVTIPFTVGAAREPMQVVENTLPDRVRCEASAPLTLLVRNRGDRRWRKGQILARVRWTTDTGDLLPGETRLAAPQSVEPGECVYLSGQLPPAPGLPGWYQVRIEQVQGDLPGVRIAAVVVPVSQEASAQFMSIELPPHLAGDADVVDVPVAVRNPGPLRWTPADTELVYQWLRWDGYPIPGATGRQALSESVEVGRGLPQRLLVRLPAGAGALRCAFGLLHHEQPAVLAGYYPAGVFLPVAPCGVRGGRLRHLDLASAGNAWAAYAERTPIPATGGIDSAGLAFPSEEFLPDWTAPALGFPVGYGSATWSPVAVGFRFGALKQGRTPMVRAQGQTLPLPPDAGGTLHLAALNAGHQAPVSFIVHYQDGTAQSVPVKISHWLDEPSYGEPVVLATRFLRSAQGDDWTLQGAVFAYALPLDPTRIPVRLELPDAPAICLLAATLALPEAPTAPAR
jgi:hypothetical protein